MTRFFSLLLGRGQLAVLGLLLTALLSCTKDDTTVAEPKTITDQILEDKQFSLLKEAMAYANAGDALKAANLTFFAPNDAAFQASGISSVATVMTMSKEQVKTMLLYHALNAPVTSSAIPSGQNTVLTASQGVAYLNNAGGGTIYVNSARVTQPDIKAANGIIHVIDRVLTPSAGSILATIQANPRLTFLAAAVKRVDSSNPSLIASLSNTSASNPLTLFAPNDDAFVAAGYKTISAIETASTQTLSSLLSYHIVSGLNLSYQIQTSSVNTLLSGNRLNLTASNGVLGVKGNKNTTPAIVRTADLVATNGVVHIIDQVLQP